MASLARSSKIISMLISRWIIPLRLPSLHMLLPSSLHSTPHGSPRVWNLSKHYMDQESKMEVTKVTNATRVFKIGEVETKALRGVDLSIQDGEFTALVGPSGSGKTTLLQLIGLLDKPTTGRVSITGQDPTNLHRNPRPDLAQDA